MSSRIVRFLAAAGAAVSLLAVPFAAQAENYGGTLRIGSFQSPRHLNSAVQSGMATTIPATQLFASLLRYDDEWNPQPYLATEWEWVDDGLGLQVQLRENAVFHDGEPITSEDVAFSIMAAKEHHPFESMFGAVEGVDTPDPHTAIIRLSQPHPALLVALSPGLSPILPKHIYDDGQDLNNHPRNLEDVVGSGPFKFKSFVPGKEVILERFDDYFIEDRPYLDRVVVQINEDVTTLFLGLQQDNLHLVPFMADSTILQMAESNPAIQMIDQGYDGVGSLVWLGINTQREPFDDVRVRQALAYALDKDFIIEALAAGYANRADGPIHSGSPYVTDDRKTYEQDHAKAKALLDEAGLTPDEEGVRFALTIDIMPGSQMYKSVAEYARQEFKQLGIDAQLRSFSDFPSYAEKMARHDYDVVSDSVWNWGDPVIGVHRTFHSDNIKNIIWTNTQGYKNERVDELLEQATVELDEEKRKELYKEFQQIVAEELPIIHISERPHHTLASPAVANPPQTIWGVLSPLDEVYLEQ